MMQSDNRFLDELARLATGAMGALHGARQEVDQLVRQRLERILGDLDLVHREEFEAVREMAARARAENEALSARVAALEAALGTAGSTATPKTPRRAVKLAPPKATGAKGAGAKAPLKPGRATRRPKA